MVASFMDMRFGDVGDTLEGLLVAGDTDAFGRCGRGLLRMLWPRREGAMSSVSKLPKGMGASTFASKLLTLPPFAVQVPGQDQEVQAGRMVVDRWRRQSRRVHDICQWCRDHKPGRRAQWADHVRHIVAAFVAEAAELGAGSDLAAALTEEGASWARIAVACKLAVHRLGVEVSAKERQLSSRRRNNGLRASSGKARRAAS